MRTQALHFYMGIHRFLDSQVIHSQQDVTRSPIVSDRMTPTRDTARPTKEQNDMMIWMRLEDPLLFT